MNKSVYRNREPPSKIGIIGMVGTSASSFVMMVIEKEKKKCIPLCSCFSSSQIKTGSHNVDQNKLQEVLLLNCKMIHHLCRAKLSVTLIYAIYTFKPWNMIVKGVFFFFFFLRLQVEIFAYFCKFRK